MNFHREKLRQWRIIRNSLNFSPSLVPQVVVEKDSNWYMSLKLSFLVADERKKEIKSNEVDGSFRLLFFHFLLKLHQGHLHSWCIFKRHSNRSVEKLWISELASENCLLSSVIGYFRLFILASHLEFVIQRSHQIEPKIEIPEEKFISVFACWTFLFLLEGKRLSQTFEGVILIYFCF
jgi:hypothetical protein